MTDKKHRRPQNGVPLNLDDFPDDFDDLIFHNSTVDSQKKIKILRSIVYQTIKNEVYDRVKSYSDDIPLEDKIEVKFKTNGYSLFEWAIVRDDLLHCGFDPKNVYDENNKLVEIVIPIERKISLTKTLEERIKEEEEYCCYSDSDSDNSSEESN